jgi:TP901 family phage tail tape measure protein
MADVIARLSVWLGIDTAAFEQGADVAEKRLAKMEREFSKLGDRISDVGKKFSVAVSIPVAAAGAAIVKSAADFEGAMIKLSISSQATAGELKQMSDLALQLGKDTNFGATDAANAMDELAKSGLSAQEILGGAAEAAVNLASATGSELSPAANAITDTMHQFALTTAQLPDAVNQITGAVNQSKLDFEDYALAIGQAGGVAGGLGVDFTDFNTVLAATSSLFASGSDAGTSFKTFLTSLTGNSKQAKEAIAAYGLEFFNANGSLKSMAEIAEQLRTKLSGLNDEAKTNVLKEIFGTDAMRTAIGLMQQGAQGLDNVAAAIKRTDAAAQAQERLKGFYGQLENLKGAIETLAIRIGQSGVLEAVTALVSKIADFVDTLSQASPGVLQFVAVVGTIAAALGPVVIGIGAVTSALAPLLAVMKAQLIPAFLLLRLELAALAVTGGTTAVAMRVLAIAIRGLLIATGVGAAIAVLAGAVYLLTRRTSEAVPATRAYSQALATAKQASKNAESAANELATAHGKARENALRAAIAERELTKQKLAGAQASLILAEYEAIRARGKARETARLASGAGPGEGVQGRISGSQQRFNAARRDAGQADANAKAAEATVLELMKAKSLLDKQIDAAMAPINLPSVAGAGGGGSEGGGGKKDRTGSGGRSAAEIEQQFQDELVGYSQQALSARQQMAGSVEEQAEYELRGVELARIRTIESIKNDKDYSDTQKKRLVEAVEHLADLERENVEFKKQAELEKQAADMAQVRFDNQRDLLQSQADLAGTQAERKRLALEILALEQEYRRNQLEMIVASKTATDAEKARAQAILDGLDAVQAGQRASVERSNETDVERYLRDLKKTPEQMNEAIDAIKIDGLQSLNNQIADAIVNFKSMGDVFANVIKQMLADLIRLQLQKTLIAPLAKFMGLGDVAGTFGGGNSIVAGDNPFKNVGNDPVLSALKKLSKIPGFAGGTSFAPGGLSLVGERGPEIVDLPRGARVTPNNELGGMRTIQVIPSQYFDVVVDGRVLRAAPGIASAGAAGGVAQIQRRGSRRLA